MNTFFRSAVRSYIRQPIVLNSFRAPLITRPFSVSSIAFNQNTTSTNTINTTSSTSNEDGPTFNQTIKEQPVAAKDQVWPLKLANELYAVVRVHSNPFLVTEGDIMTLPYHLKTAEVGDTLNFTDVSCVGSRNFTLADDPVDSNLITVKGIVIEKTKMPMRITKVKKRRTRRTRHALSKPHKTLVRVTEIKLK